MMETQQIQELNEKESIDFLNRNLNKLKDSTIEKLRILNLIEKEVENVRT